MPKEMRATKTNLKRLFFTCRFQWSFFYKWSICK